MISWITPEITPINYRDKNRANILFAQFKIKPSKASEANNTCDVATDVIVVADSPIALNMQFFSHSEAGSRIGKYYLGSIKIYKEMFDLVAKQYIAEDHKLHVPIFSTSGEKMVGVFLAIPEDVADYARYEKIDDLVIKLGVDRA